MEKIVALDVGEKRIGIAVCDALGITAQPVESYTRVGAGRDCAYLADKAASLGASRVVVGLPLNMNGTEGPQAEKTRAFARKLRAHTGLAIVFIDERLTTAAARRALIEGGVRREKRRQVIDSIAAVHILTTYLENPNLAKTEEETP